MCIQPQLCAKLHVKESCIQTKGINEYFIGKTSFHIANPQECKLLSLLSCSIIVPRIDAVGSLQGG